LNQWLPASGTPYSGLTTLRIDPSFNPSSCGGRTKKSLFRRAFDWT
jgi:hypothetical protein